MKELDIEAIVQYAKEQYPEACKQKAIHEERDRKLEEAREDRAKIRAQQAAAKDTRSTRP